VLLMKTTVTIKDIAEQLNLSRNTVAKALNGKYVPESTRERVMAKAIELNYKSLNFKANEIQEKKYRILLLACKPLNNIRFFSPIIRSIENYCYGNDYDLFQFTYNLSLANFDVLKEYIENLNVDGIIAIESFDHNLINKLFKLEIPITFIDCCTNIATLSSKNFDVIESSNFIPIFNITSKLISKYKISHFTYVGDETHCLSFHERYLAMISSLASNNIVHTKNDDITRNDNFDYGNIEMLKSEIVKLKYTTDCFICGNDFIARNICKALAELGKKVPEEVLVVGYDNVAESVASTPKITTVSTDPSTIGNTAIKTLIERIKNPEKTSIIYTVRSSIIERQSTLR